MLPPLVLGRYEEGRTLFGVSRVFILHLECWLPIGRYFSPVEWVERWTEYTGMRDIAKMAYVPLAIAAKDGADARQTLARLHERGEASGRLNGQHHFLSYAPRSFAPSSKGSRRSAAAAGAQGVARQGGGRMVVDSEAAAEAGVLPTSLNYWLSGSFRCAFRTIRAAMRTC